MADNSKIEWTDATWNIITGCSVVSPGCTNCYAMRLAGTRLRGIPSRSGLTRDSKAGPVWTGEVRFNDQWLDQPLRWKRPRMVFVCAHGDLFAEGVTDEMLDKVFAVMALAPQHTFQVLTKRPERMRSYFADKATNHRIAYIAYQSWRWKRSPPETTAHDEVVEIEQNGIRHRLHGRLAAWPLPNVWLGVSVEDQTRANERIPVLLDTPAAVRWVSAEPLLGPVDFTSIDTGSGWVDSLQSYIRYPTTTPGHFLNEPIDWPRIDWIVAGGESGSGARPMHPDWARGIRDQCADAGVAFTFKQWGAWASVSEVAGSGAHHSFPDGATVRQVGKRAAGRSLDGQIHDAQPGGVRFAA
ncbi:hypothetical protein [Aurantimonas phage AmM-1]|uniref:hypothetical protein n=1 Tax=Aurantimonas phage AmM-1 TaxID=1503929 RepID=UPI0005412091|nr:hypothetical protein ACQ23_gp47 [Aurantimonas phage AmM-1]BAP94504.1 hypothetical protein [Aurantimonas phage AmM-1]